VTRSVVAGSLLLTFVGMVLVAGRGAGIPLSAAQPTDASDPLVPTFQVVQQGRKEPRVH